jgi:DNA-binding NarL/FixJ family response regulator
VVRGQEAIAQRFLQAQRTARREVLILDKPPYAVAQPERQAEVQCEQLQKGISYRTVYDADALADAEQLTAARELARCGERSRMLRGVPLKLVLTDGRAALLRTGDEIIELGPSSLLDGLVVLFELLWRRATPLWQEPAATRNGPAHSLTADDEQLLALAAAGLTDQAIARRLGVAQRTVERRMQRIMRALDATTRFQAGLRAAQRGILTG